MSYVTGFAFFVGCVSLFGIFKVYVLCGVT